MRGWPTNYTDGDEGGWSVGLSIYILLNSIDLCAHPCIYLSVCLSVCLSVYLSICELENGAILRDFSNSRS